MLLLVGFLVGVLFLAQLLPPALRQPAPAGLARLLAYFGGALFIVLLAARVPFVGGLGLAVVSVLGVGACVLELYQRRRGPGAPAAAADGLPVTPVSPA